MGARSCRETAAEQMSQMGMLVSEEGEMAPGEVVEARGEGRGAERPALAVVVGDNLGGAGLGTVGVDASVGEALAGHRLALADAGSKGLGAGGRADSEAGDDGR